MRMRSLILASVCTVLAACAAAPQRGPNPRLVQVQSVAGKPVGSVSYLGRLYSWESIDDQHVLLYTRPRQAYLLEVVPCPGLDSAIMLGVTSRYSSITAGIDSVITGWKDPGSFPCRIQTIRPVDVKALRAAEKAAEKPEQSHEVKVLPRPKDKAGDGTP